MGLEPMTSPLPRECSTAELHQLHLRNSYYSTVACSTIVPRTHACQQRANDEKSQQHQRQCTGLAGLHGEPCQTGQHRQHHQRNNQPSVAARLKAHCPPLKTLLNADFAVQNSWCTGEDSNLRSSKERQIYSLLPLTARPPVHSTRQRLPGHAATCLLSSRDQTSMEGSIETEPADQRNGRGGCGRRAAHLNHCKTVTRKAAAAGNWSWRRDLNPRPSDYKSDALPAELRQPVTAMRRP